MDDLVDDLVEESAAELLCQDEFQSPAGLSSECAASSAFYSAEADAERMADFLTVSL